MDPPPPRGQGCPRKNQIDEEVASASHNPNHNRNPKNNLNFKFHQCLNQGSFHPWLLRHTKHTWIFGKLKLKLKLRQAKYHTVPYSVPPSVKKARLLRCETFSETVDAIVAKNWLKRITDTLTDMELDDSLKLKVATTLMDKSAATWWDNLKLHTSTPIIWSYLCKNSMISFILGSIETRKDKSSLNWGNWEGRSLNMKLN